MAKSVTKKEDNVVAISDAQRRQYAGAGMEGVETEDLTPPRLKLAQPLSPELETIDELKAGKFFNTITEDVFDTVNIIPIKSFRTYVLFPTMDSGEPPIAFSSDGVHWDDPDAEYHHPEYDGVVWKTAKTVKGSGLADFGSSNPGNPKSNPAATKFLNFLCLDADNIDGGLFLFSFSRTGLKNGGSLNSQIMAGGNIPWNNTYLLDSSAKTYGAGKYYVPKTRSIGKTPDDIWQACAGLYDSLAGKTIQTGEERGEDTSAAGDDDGDEIPF